MNASALRIEPVPRRSLVFVGEQRLCRGPLHPEGEWLSPHAFYRHSDGQGKFYFRRECKRCYNHTRHAHGWISADRMAFAVEELVGRLGIAEVTRRTGVTATTLRKNLKREARWMQHPTAEKLIRALRVARANQEVRHIDSVRHGAAMRGRTEKQPKLPGEYYRTKLVVKAEREAYRVAEVERQHERRVAERQRQRRRKSQREWVARKRALARASMMKGVEPMDLYWETAESVCTAKQFRVLELKERHGFSLRQIALTCDIAVGTVRVHLDAAHRNIHKALRASA